MTNFTPSELKYCAETILPAPDDLSVWRTRENYEGESFAYSAYYGVFDPDEKDTQFRALVEWCVENGFVIRSLIDSFTCVLCEGCITQGNTLVDCMIAAVLAHRGDSDADG